MDLSVRIDNIKVEDLLKLFDAVHVPANANRLSIENDRLDRSFK